MMIALLCMVVQTAWAEWEGSRTQANPYQISSVADWNTLATNVEAGNNNPTDLSSIKQSEIFSVTISVVTEKLLVVNQGSISLNVAAATITAQTKSEEVYGYQGTGIRPSIRTIETDGTSRYFDLHGRHIGKKPVSGVYIHYDKKFVSTPRR